METGLNLGTPQYMSPEQTSGDREVDGRSDLYYLGAVLSEMLSGKPPQTGPTGQAIIAKLLTDPPEASPKPKVSCRGTQESAAPVFLDPSRAPRPDSLSGFRDSEDHTTMCARFRWTSTWLGTSRDVGDGVDLHQQPVMG